jgi:hypothetical protein
VSQSEGRSARYNQYCQIHDNAFENGQHSYFLSTKFLLYSHGLACVYYLVAVNAGCSPRLLCTWRSTSMLLAFQDVAETSDTVPAAAVAFQGDPVDAVRTRLTVFTRPWIVKALIALVTQIDHDTDWFFMEIVEGQEGVVAPFIADREDVRGSRFEDVIGSPAKLGAFLSSADHALGPVQHGIRIPPLGFDVYSPVTPGFRLYRTAFLYQRSSIMARRA